MLHKLENYYRRAGILSTAFECAHLPECRGAARDFTEAKSAFVGARYGATKLPRLLFISADPGSAKTDNKNGAARTDFTLPENRTPAGVQNLVMRRVQLIKDGDMKSSPRLRSTNEMAFVILRAFDSAIAEESVMLHYAHTNAAKCCQNKSERKEADGKLFRNCRDYLRGEIETLAPDILITHGKKAEDGVTRVFAEESFADVAPNAVCKTTGARFFWMRTPHPSSYGRPQFLKQKRGEDGGPGWAGYIKQMRRFMNARR